MMLYVMIPFLPVICDRNGIRLINDIYFIKIFSENSGGVFSGSGSSGVYH